MRLLKMIKTKTNGKITRTSGIFKGSVVISNPISSKLLTDSVSRYFDLSIFINLILVDPNLKSTEICSMLFKMKPDGKSAQLI